MQPPIYDPEAVKPMWQELAAVGVEPLTTPEQVDAAVDAAGTALVVVNSVCGCAAGHARPGVMAALQGDRIPDRFVTVFAGVDRDAVDAARARMREYPPSSPSVGLFKDGKHVFMLERFQIQEMTAEDVARVLKKAFDEHCERQGPSIAPEEFAKIRNWEGCGSQIPLHVAR